MSQFRNLVFEGGGVKGIAYAGAISVLEGAGAAGPILTDIRRVAGASAGAITAALLALGASAEEVREIVGSTKFRTFMDDSFGLLRDVDRLVHDYGWYKGDAFSQWMKKQVQSLTGRPELTFGELGEKISAEAKSKKRRFKELFVVGTNLSTQMETLFCSEYTPDVPIWRAVRISMSIPLFFAAVRERNDLFVDGGVSWNYPIDLFDDKMYEPASGAAVKVDYPTKYGPEHVFNKETLGFRVDTSDEIKAEKDNWRSPPKSTDSFVGYVGALVGYILEMATKQHLHANDWHRTVFLEADGVRATDFDLSEEQVKGLFDSGVAGTKKYLAWFNNPKEAPLNRV